MKVISVRQPYAALILAGLKTYETREYPFPEECKGQRILIHISKTTTGEERKCAYDTRIRPALRRLGYTTHREMPRGIIAGSVQVTGCIECWRLTDGSGTYLHLHSDPEQNAFEMTCGNFVGEYAWTLALPRQWSSCFPWSGHRGIWEIDDEEAYRMLARQVVLSPDRGMAQQEKPAVAQEAAALAV
jgi:hypothetical protein